MWAWLISAENGVSTFDLFTLPLCAKTTRLKRRKKERKKGTRDVVDIEKKVH